MRTFVQPFAEGFVSYRFSGVFAIATSSIARNIAANLAAKIWTVLVSLAVVPVYLHVLGVEAYGLLGFFLSLTAIFAVLDLGLGNSLNRQLAQYSVQPGAEQKMRDLVRTLESIYWLLGVVAGIGVALLAPLIAAHWINAEKFSADEVTRALELMGVAIAVQWPRALYIGGLMGLQRQVAQNAVSSGAATVLGAGGAILVTSLAPSVHALLGWMIAVGLAETLSLRAVLLRSLPAAAAPARFSRGELAAVWRFAAGITGISLLAMVLGQLDKVILSKLLTLEAFGYYMLAWRVAGAFYLLISPVQSAYFPRLTQLATLGDERALAQAYHRGSQAMSVILLPAAALVSAFAGELLRLWTLDARVAASAGPILAVLAAGTAANGLMYLPTTAQLAFGRTRLILVSNVVAVVLLAPAIWLVANRYGGLGAAWIWLLLNFGYVAFMLPLMHRRVLPRELGRWLLADVGAPLAAVAAVVGACRLLFELPAAYAAALAGLAAVFVVAQLAAIAAAPQVRAALAARLRPGAVS
jgi:O-antigen/teichoic acid export membrane protein